MAKFLESGAKPNFDEDATDKTALDIAVEMRKSEIVELLKKHGGQEGSETTRWQGVAEEIRKELLKASKNRNRANSNRVSTSRR